jgi:hypothetical protein
MAFYGAKSFNILHFGKIDIKYLDIIEM